MLIHPNIGKLYRQKIADLADALNDEKRKVEAAEIIFPSPEAGLMVSAV